MNDEILVEDFNLNEEDSTKGNNSPKKKKNKKGKKKKALRNTIIVFEVLAVLYCVGIFSNIPIIEKWRTIYIETAMTTNSHQWLATYFIPGYIIDDVMEQYRRAKEEQMALESKWQENQKESETQKVDPKEEFFEKYWELDTVSFRNYLDQNPSLIQNGYDNILIQDMDNELGLTTTNGDAVLAVDTANNLLLVGLDESNDFYFYKAKMAIIKNPEQIELAKAKTFGSVGELVDTFAEDNDALLAINASGFSDAGGHGNGAQVKGSMIIDGQEYGVPHAGFWKFYGMKYDNRLYVSNYSQDITSGYRWGIEFFPALIVDGENVVDRTYGMGIQPRTAIGQTASGDFIMLIVDGRQPTHSMGCTVEDCSNVLMSYKAVQGANLDGGSSAVMWYNGEQITKSSSKAGNGRYMPNALIVKKMSNMSSGSTGATTSQSTNTTNSSN